jgi:hypothetical protein
VKSLMCAVSLTAVLDVSCASSSVAESRGPEASVDATGDGQDGSVTDAAPMSDVNETYVDATPPGCAATVVVSLDGGVDADLDGSIALEECQSLCASAVNDYPPVCSCHAEDGGGTLACKRCGCA